MVCLEWQGGQCPPAGCPKVNWFWWLAAGLLLLGLVGKKKKSNGK